MELFSSRLSTEMPEPPFNPLPYGGLWEEHYTLSIGRVFFKFKGEKKDKVNKNVEFLLRLQAQRFVHSQLGAIKASVFSCSPPARLSVHVTHRRHFSSGEILNASDWKNSSARERVPAS